RINRILGAPADASTAFGKSGDESLTVRPILPWNGGSGFGKTVSSVGAASAAPGELVATVDAATSEVEPSHRSRRLIPPLLPCDRDLDGMRALSSFIGFLPGEPHI